MGKYKLIVAKMTSLNFLYSLLHQNNIVYENGFQDSTFNIKREFPRHSESNSNFTEVFYNNQKLAWGCHDLIEDRVACIGVMPDASEADCLEIGCCYDSRKEIACASKSVWMFSD